MYILGLACQLVALKDPDHCTVILYWSHCTVWWPWGRPTNYCRSLKATYMLIILVSGTTKVKVCHLQCVVWPWASVPLTASPLHCKLTALNHLYECVHILESEAIVNDNLCAKQWISNLVVQFGDEQLLWKLQYIDIVLLLLGVGCLQTCISFPSRSESSTVKGGEWVALHYNKVLKYCVFILEHKQDSCAL